MSKRVHTVIFITSAGVTDNMQEGVKFLKHIDENVPKFVCGDPTRFCQIAINLLSNAVKFTSEGKVELIVKRINIAEHNVLLEKFRKHEVGIKTT